MIAISGKAQVRLDVFGGPQITSARYTVNGVIQPASFKFGAMAGLGAKVEFDNNFYFAPYIAYDLLGYKVTLNSPSYPPTELAKNNNTTIHTVEMAPLFQIDLDRKPDHYFIRFGLAIDYALAGTEKFDTTGANGNTGTIKRSMLFAYTDYGRATASVNAQFGYEMQNGFLLFVHYSYGIGSMNQNDGGPGIFHRAIGLSGGWMFGKLKPKPKKSIE